MANLIQKENSYAYYQGWYGTLSETGNDVCESFSLLNGDILSPTSLTKKYPEILNVFEISANGEGQTTYSGVLPDGFGQSFQAIKELKCGHSYRIILKKSTEYKPTEPTIIEEFTSSHAGINDDLEKNRLALNCEVDTGCPTCEDYTGSSSTFNIDLKNLPTTAQESVHVVVYDSSVEGTLCYAEVDTGLPKT